MVSNETFVGKPVAVINASPRAVHAQASIIETLTTMSARVVEEASIGVPILGSQLDEAGIVAHPDISIVLLEALQALQMAVVRFPVEDSGLGEPEEFQP